MNYHSDNWINEKVHDHYMEAREYFPDNSIVGIFLQGSQNYGLDYEGSDRHNNGTETFTNYYTTKSGDKIVAFGYYGYD